MSTKVITDSLGQVSRLLEGHLADQRQLLDQVGQLLSQVEAQWDNPARLWLAELGRGLEAQAQGLDTAASRLSIAAQLYKLVAALEGDAFEALASVADRPGGAESRNKGGL